MGWMVGWGWGMGVLFVNPTYPRILIVISSFKNSNGQSVGLHTGQMIRPNDDIIGTLARWFAETTRWVAYLPDDLLKRQDDWHNCQMIGTHARFVFTMIVLCVWSHWVMKVYNMNKLLVHPMDFPKTQTNHLGRKVLIHCVWEIINKVRTHLNPRGKINPRQRHDSK